MTTEIKASSQTDQFGVGEIQAYDNVLQLIGNTPLVRLPKLTRGLKPTVLAKLEMLNPGGSVKDRIGIRMIEEAEKRGLLRKGGTIIEPTSGNTGVGLAIAAAIKGYKAIFIMPDKMSQEKISLLKAYGAEVVITPTSVARESPESYYSVADRLAREIPGGFQPNQYFNPMNPQTHYETTGPELWQQTAGKIDYFVAGVGTGGTISGVAKYLKEQNPAIRIVGVDPEGSLYTQSVARPYKIEGIGEDFIPGTVDLNLIDEWVTVSDRDAFLMARKAVREEGILVGGSCGAALVGALEVAKNLDESKVVVVLLPDSGRSYLSKIYNDAWMHDQGFTERFPSHPRVFDLIHSHKPGQNEPPFFTVRADETVAEAISLLHQHGISQLPVTGELSLTGKHVIVGSLQERTLLEKIFKNPEIVIQTVEQIMDTPLPTVDESEEIEAIISLFTPSTPALVIEHEGEPVGIISRSDLLEFIAQQRKNQ
ncbi:cystathionine beta-synthase [Candidatus Chlorohelix allophototropha]|uniref:Cystathionine beta-synthase n=1 Tax=Candidatus Chlorohelix allophototropha TaxID=3003348 RepID=A0ABY9AXV8_9CHLR|nr:cystathionine beta-synthase [Chloroflexota bacterium L227-S17]